uniref:Uncharacterized protein n=1 Tax=Arundo donax TaxID=35708 RepID=A0A0A8YEM1_ARUDO
MFRFYLVFMQKHIILIFSLN